MATYEGVILTDIQSLNLEPKVFLNAKKLTILDEPAEEVQRVIMAEKIELFLMGGENDEASKKTRRLLGHTTWGDDNQNPRRYPLETSWTKK